MDPGDVVGSLTLVRHTRLGNRPAWVCSCVCGELKTIRTYDLARGKVKTCGCSHLRTGPSHRNWKGGITSQGYRRFPEGLEHRLVMENKLGRRLLPTETVHHKNGNRLDNRPSNLELWNSPHPSGQRVDDITRFAIAHLKTYNPELLSELA